MNAGADSGFIISVQYDEI